jgi:hypothetical protein
MHLPPAALWLATLYVSQLTGRLCPTQRVV